MRRLWINIVKGLLNLLLVFLITTAVIYFLARLFPGDTITVLYGEVNSLQDGRRILEAKLGLDIPLYIQLISFWQKILVGDWGISIFAGKPVFDLVFQRYVNSLMLSFTATLTTTAVCILLAYLSFTRRCRRLTTLVASISTSIPAALWGVILMVALVLAKVSIPFGSIIMPLITLTIAGVGVFYTILKSLIDEALSEPFMAFYRAMGLTKSRLFLKALRYALPMYITAVLYRMGLIIAGAVATETIFNYPGMGKLLIDAFASRDYPVLLGWAVIISLTLAALNIAGDVMQDILDPRVRELM